MPQRLNPDGPSGSLFQGAAGGVRLDLSRRNATGKYDIAALAGSIREVFGEAAKKRKSEKEAQAEALGVEVYTAQQDLIRTGQDAGGKLAKLTERVNKHPIAQEPFMRGVAKAKSERGFDEFTMKLNPLTETYPVTDENGAPLPMDEITSGFLAAANEVEASVSYLADLQGDPYVGEQTRTALESQKFAFLAEVQKRAAGANVEWVQNALGHRVTMRLQEGIKGTTGEEGVAAMRQTLSEILRDARNDNTPNATNIVVGAGMAYIEKMLSTDGGSEAALAAIETLSEFEVNGARVDLDPQWSVDLAKYEQQAHEQENRAGVRELQTLQNYSARAQIRLAAFLGTDENVARMLRGERETLREEATAALAQSGLNDPSLAGLVDTAFDELTRGFTERTGPANPESARAYDAAVLDINTSVGELMSFTNIGPEREANRLQEIARRENWLRVTQAGQSFIEQELGAAGAVSEAVKALGSDASVAAQDIGARLDSEFQDALAEHAKNVIVPAGLSPAAEYEALRKFSREQGPIFRKKLADELGTLRSQVTTARDSVRNMLATGKRGDAETAINDLERSGGPEDLVRQLRGLTIEYDNSLLDAQEMMRLDSENPTLASRFITDELNVANILGEVDDKGNQFDERSAGYEAQLKAAFTELGGTDSELLKFIDTGVGKLKVNDLRNWMRAKSDEIGSKAFGTDWAIIRGFQQEQANYEPWHASLATSATPEVDYFRTIPMSEPVATALTNALAQDRERALLTLVSAPRGGTFNDPTGEPSPYQAMVAAGATNQELFDVFAPYALTPEALIRGTLVITPQTGNSAEPDIVIPIPETVNFLTVGLGNPESLRRWSDPDRFGMTASERARNQARRDQLVAASQARGGPSTFDGLLAMLDRSSTHVVNSGQSTSRQIGIGSSRVRQSVVVR